MDINKDLDKGKTYTSPSGEQAAIFINNKWNIFIRMDVIPQHVHPTLTFNQPQEKEFSLFNKWKDEDDRDDYSGTIKHFQD